MDLKSDLENLANWCKGNKLSIHIKKTKSMIVGTTSMVKKHAVIPKLKILNKDKGLEKMHYSWLPMTNGDFIVQVSMCRSTGPHKLKKKKSKVVLSVTYTDISRPFQTIGL